ncbi:ADP-ribosylation factor 1 [Morella rubra]|uniref:ADP-ribosylation factor 1 n=1 Tax=Morella rubra TaxID=262757 RepID=A0A6A1VR37_9ROSI|nr:ADP-ribosylation factor 1 [Morella rubra]
MAGILFELVPLIVEAVEGAAVEGAVVEAAAVETAAVEGAMMETALVEGAAVEGAAVEGAAVEGAAVEAAEGAAAGPATALKGFAAKALTNFTMGVLTGGGFFVGTEVFKLLKDKIQGTQKKVNNPNHEKKEQEEKPTHETEKQDKKPTPEKQEVGILMVGLYGAGKTTILYAMNIRPVVTKGTPNGIPIETVESNGVRLTARDVGKIDKEPPSLDHANCVIFVVDSNDRDRISEAREELHRMLGEDNLPGKPLLVFANKKDIPNAMSTSEITAKLGLTPDIGCLWHVQATRGTSGEGLNEGFSWLIENISKGKMILALP